MGFLGFNSVGEIDEYRRIFAELADSWKPVLGRPEFIPRDLSLQPCFDFGSEYLDVPDLKTEALKPIAAAFRYNVIRVKLMMVQPALIGELAARVARLMDIAEVELTGTIRTEQGPHPQTKRDWPAFS